MKKPPNNRAALLIVVLSILAVGLGCSSLFGGTASSEKAVERFHQQFNDGQFDDIYSGGSKEFKDAAPQNDFVAMLRHINGRLGKMKSKSLGSWGIRTVGIGSVVELKYDTEFENGPGKEKFTFLMVNDEPKLLGYEVEADKLKN